jgi:hypothetical protein
VSELRDEMEGRRMKRGRIGQTSMERQRIVTYVKQLFRHDEFPGGFCVAMDDTTLVNKGDVVPVYLDSEHPYDFIPLPSFDQLILNLPTKEEFLQRTGFASIEEVTAEAEAAFWEDFEFEFAPEADGVKLTWE